MIIEFHKSNLHVFIGGIDGKSFNFSLYARNLIKGQDMEYWKAHPVDFMEWVKKCIRQRVDKLYVYVLTGHSKPFRVSRLK